MLGTVVELTGFMGQAYREYAGTDKVPFTPALPSSTSLSSSCGVLWYRKEPSSNEDG
jgi:hypothetical protein